MNINETLSNKNVFLNEKKNPSKTLFDFKPNQSSNPQATHRDHSVVKGFIILNIPCILRHTPGGSSSQQPRQARPRGTTVLAIFFNNPHSPHTYTHTVTDTRAMGARLDPIYQLHQPPYSLIVRPKYIFICMIFNFVQSHTRTHV